MTVDDYDRLNNKIKNLVDEFGYLNILVLLKENYGGNYREVGRRPKVITDERIKERIMFLYNEGVSIRKIRNKIIKEYNIDYHRNTINNFIHRQKENYSSKQIQIPGKPIKIISSPPEIKKKKLKMKPKVSKLTKDELKHQEEKEARIKKYKEEGDYMRRDYEISSKPAQENTCTCCQEPSGDDDLCEDCKRKGGDLDGSKRRMG